ncbi:hypothetical protein Q1695_014970 [Nippostrongylus brasiliensis]|nr:hypothetical protein Q1695_014970 [Nippostrongylus brasiliensis]
MSNTEIPRAYARTASSSSSSSVSSDSSDWSSRSRYFRRRHSTTSSSTTPDYNRSLRRRVVQRRSERKRRKSRSSSRSGDRSCRDRKRQRTESSSSSSASSTSTSSSSEGKRRSCKSSYPVRHGQADRRERFYSPRPMPNRTNQRTYDCHCGEKYGSRKALIHHTIQNHDADVPCFACNQNIPSLSQLLEHFKTDHPKALILCVYCKSVFGKADAMTDNQWKRLKTHMYGELVYAKLAEMPEQKVSWFSFACFKRNQLCVLQVGPDSEE